jgi:hypothetical protein
VAGRCRAADWPALQEAIAGRVILPGLPGVCPYPNFPGPDLQDWARAYYGASYGRMLRVKAHHDPDNFFRFHQSLPSLAPARWA